MCGIVGYVGQKKNANFLIEKLKKLEYRGYDSAGFANLSDGKIKVFKESGNIDNLKKSVDLNLEIECAIAHTRWATHGKPVRVNAHPHSSFDEKWTIVHNGIIENFEKLKSTLTKIPESSTDTAVIAELLGERKAKSFDDFVDCFQAIVGSYAIVALNSDKSNELFLAKNKSPLYVAKNESGDFLVASDPICFSKFSTKYYTMLDGEFAHISGGKISFRNQNNEQIEKQEKILDEMFEDDDMKNYDHFMIKEIMEQPVALLRQIKTYRDSGVLEKFDLNFAKKFKRVKFIGCGTAYHAGLVGARYIAKIVGIQADAEVASEFIYNEPIFADPETLFVFVSQSGETADTIRGVEIAKEHGATCIALTNVLYSTIANKTDYVLPVCAGPEIAVASTKAYVCQLSALYLFAQSLARKKPLEICYKEIESLSKRIFDFNFKQVEDLAEDIKNSDSVIFIGKDVDYVSACEASLKLKEVAYINTASYPSGELKHGFLALVERGTPLFVFAGNKLLNTKTFNASIEAVSRGAYEIVLTNQKLKENENRKVLFFDEPNELLLPILFIVPMQYLAYKVSIKKGINPDQPRNLAKSVTVE
jgi:glucosamine--fructose-6-phosphate aminotransferase (isomerizing)